MAAGLSACCLLLLMLLAEYASPAPGFLSEGSPCWDAVSASNGTCLKAVLCQGALAAARDRRTLPSRCGFVTLNEIVCCTDGHNGGTQRDGKLPDPDEDIGAWADVFASSDLREGLLGRLKQPTEVEGSACWDAATASAGTCRSPDHCQGPLAAMRARNTPPSSCGFVDLDKIVCCTDGHNDGTQPGDSFPDYDGDGDNDDRDLFGNSDIWAGLDPSVEEGSPCWDAASASAGTCRSPHHCQGALAAMRARNTPPSRCGFVGLDEIVCCTDGHNDGTQLGDSFPDYDGDGDNGDRDLFGDSDIWAGLGPSVEACSRFKYQRIATPALISGDLVRLLELPHMAAIGYKLPGTKGISWNCGGALISYQFVLTAAHCCVKRPVQVRLGAVDLTSPGDEYNHYGISEIIIHPSYRRRHLHSDIALLKLDRSVGFGQAVFPACLNTQHSDPPSFTAAGWGATNPIGTRQSSTLMKSTVHLFQLSDCKNAYKERFPKENFSSLICAGDPEGKTDTCGGDSGGPLVVGRSAPYTVVGITSIGLRPCGGNRPAIYTRVSDYIDWIEDHVWPSGLHATE